MARSRSSLLAAGPRLVVLGLLAACSVPPTTFTPEEDGGSAGPPSLVLTPTSATVGEGATAMFTVALSAEPASRVHVSLASADDNRLGVMPASIDLDPASWAVAHAVLVTGKSDADTEDELVAITVDADADAIADGRVMVTIEDDDDLGIVVTPPGGLQVDEGMAAPLMVRLNAPPTGDVDVAVASSDLSIATVSPDTLHFTIDTWNLDQTVVVNGTIDGDSDHEDATVMLAATDLDPVPVAVQVVDRDVQGIVTSTPNLGTRAEGTTVTFGVTLRFQPTTGITVAAGTSDPSVATVTPASLAFDSGNWNTPHVVTVTLPEDLDTVDESAELELTAPPLIARQVGVSVTDDDEPRIEASLGSVTLVEGGMRGVDVKLAYQPEAAVTLAVTTLDGLVASASPAMVTFTPGNYAQAQSVVVTAVQDLDPDNESTVLRLASTTDPLSRDLVIAVTDDDQQLIDTTTGSITLGEAGTATFGVRLHAMPAAAVTVNLSSGDPTAAAVTPASLTFSSGNYAAEQTVTVSGVHDLDLAAETVTINLAASAIPSALVTAMVSDDDTQRVLVSPGAISVNEAGSGTLNVSLQFTPAGNTTVDLTSLDTGVAIVSPASLSFTPGNHATPRSITVSGVNDVDAMDETTTIVASSNDATSGMAAVTVNDDDPLGITTSVTTLTVGEGAQATFGVRLTAQPPATTTVMLASSDGSAATVAGTTLTFTTGNWNSNQTVVVTGIADVDPLDEAVTVTLTSSGLATRTVAVTVADDDPQGIVTSAGAVTLTESGSASFDVHLAAMPATAVTVSVASADINAATAAPATLTFTPSNYATDQAVTVSGVDDLDMASHAVAINLTSSGLPTRTVTAMVNNVDVQAIQATPGGTITVNEGGTAAVGFRLAFRPTAASTVVTLSPAAGVGVTPATLTFTPANHATAQSASVSGTQDADAAGTSTSITASAASISPLTVPVTVVDDDPLLLELTLPSVMIGEAGSATVGVRLTAQPPATTTVTASSSDPGAATALPATLTFTTGNWNTYQDLTIAGVNDTDVASEGVTVTVSSAPLPSQTIGVTVSDDDVVDIVPSVSSLVLDEPSSGSFTVVLGHQPAAGLTVTVASTDGTAATVAPATLSFNTLNWATAQTVTVTGVSDADADAESVTINLTSPGAPVSGAVEVTVRDDELILSDLSVQMGSAMGGTSLTATGAGFTPATTLALAARTLVNVLVPSATQLTGTTQNGSRFVDAVATKGAVTATIPRAYYHGTWEPASTGVWGGPLYAVVAAGTSSAYAGTAGGVFRSTDSGATWTAASSGLVVNGATYGLAVDPQNPQRLYATSGSGLFVTTNGGTSWAVAGGLTQSTMCVSVAPSSSSVVYACGNTHVQRSLDGGATWSAVYALDGTNNIAISAQDPNVAYVSSQYGLYKTVNGGSSWSQVYASPVGWVAIDPSNASIAYITYSTTGAWKTTNGGTSWSPLNTNGLTPTRMFVHPTTPATVYATTWNGVYRSIDAGASWSQVSNGIPSFAKDVYALAFRPGNSSEMLAGTRETGIYKTTNAAASWSESDIGFAAYTTSFIAPHPTIAGTVFMSVRSLGLWKSVDHGATWTLASTGLPETPQRHSPMSIVFTPGTPSTMYAGMPGSNTSVYKSTDGGASWLPSANGIPTDRLIHAMTIDPAAPATVYAGTWDGVYRSTNAGASWSLLNSGLTNPYVAALAPLGGAIYAGTQTGVFRSADGGGTWSPVNTGLPSNLGAARLVADPTEGALFVQTYSETYRTTDAGATWTCVATGSSDVAVDPTRSATVYIAGAYHPIPVRRSLTSLATLASFADGMPSTLISAIGVDRTGGTVYAAAHGRGLWRVGGP
ncbi:MAG TPA: hypothetical protein VM261_16805 [Kofleriaceae bacterium]|nr:hypothetical protein [Kofleriaceae bacterium]